MDSSLANCKECACEWKDGKGNVKSGNNHAARIWKTGYMQRALLLPIPHPFAGKERQAARKRLRILRQYPIHFDYRHRVCTVDRGAGAILSTLPVESQHNSNQLGGREE